MTRAAIIFHKALMLYRKLPESYDIAMALFVSALETVDLPLSSPETCAEFSQPRHKISHRLVELGEKHLGDGVERIFKESYQRRSKYLHAGQVKVSQPMVSHTIPQLDPEGNEGCAMPATIGAPINLMEFTSFVIRREILLNDQAAYGTLESTPGEQTSKI
ncbi:hypothetical protein [Agrobacterium rosae]|uniref:hypothetical protein n=1 Tax=Agrobacterium rosae TaxID=1972867 RepID=UPI0020348C78|nr:hypothetical protein [Agrobacterium rosae]MCM2435825.1 hypothetical protein [Agrobacterium rosae]